MLCISNRREGPRLMKQEIIADSPHINWNKNGTLQTENATVADRERKGGEFGEDTGSLPPPHWAGLHEQVGWIFPDGEESQ